MKVLALLIIGLALSNSSPLINDPDYKAPFPIKFYFDVATKKPTTNLVVSPASVTVAMALAYMGATGKTAEEFKDVLNFPGSSQQEIAKVYGGDFLTYLKSKATKDLSFTMANRIYVDEKFTLKPTYNQLATEFFGAAAENVQFSNKVVAADKINSWVAHETHDKVKNIVKADSFDDETAAVLVNAVYFKAPWASPFKKVLTTKHDFFLNKNDKVQVDMMQRTGTYEVADWSHIDATAIRIPYAHSDIYMLIVLPNRVDGLADMLEKFKVSNHVKMQTLPQNEYISISLPKFKFEFDISLVPVLEEMGLKQMFTNNAEFANLLDTDRPIKITDVKHKAFIEVDEDGTEAAASTAVEFVMVTASLNAPTPRSIVVDHPFMFAIRDQKNVYFAGHVANF